MHALKGVAGARRRRQPGDGSNVRAAGIGHRGDKAYLGIALHYAFDSLDLLSRLLIERPEFLSLAARRPHRRTKLAQVLARRHENRVEQPGARQAFAGQLLESDAER